MIRIERDYAAFPDRDLHVYHVKENDGHVVGTITHAPLYPENGYTCWVDGAEIARCRTYDEAAAVHFGRFANPQTQTPRL